MRSPTTLPLVEVRLAAPVIPRAVTLPLVERAGGRVHIVVNCKDLDYISSAGLGVFMGCIEDVRERDGDIKISNLMPKVFHVFELLGFHQLYDLTDTEEEAVGKFAS